MNLTGKRVIITGAASGLGRALLDRLVPLAATIVAADDNAGALEETMLKLQTNRVSPFVGNLGDAGTNAALFDHALSVMGGVDVYVASGAITYYERIGAADWARIEKIFRVNVFAPIYAAERMRDLHPNGGYTMVFTASATAFFPTPGFALYGATNAALDRFAEAYRAELPPNTQFSVIYPITTRARSFKSNASMAQFAETVIKGIGEGKMKIYPSRWFNVMRSIYSVIPAFNLTAGAAKRQLRQWDAKQR